MTMQKHQLAIPAGLAAGLIAAVTTLLTPIGMIENFAASSGLSELIPQTAPPLGATARLIIAFIAAVMAAGVVLALIGSAEPATGAAPSDNDTDAQPARRAYSMRISTFMSSLTSPRRSRPVPADAAAQPVSSFAPEPATSSAAATMSSESWLAHVKRKLNRLAGRGDDGAGIREFADLPRLRAADRHPDAPPRRPISALSDLNGLAQDGPCFAPDERPAAATPAAAPAEASAPIPAHSARPLAPMAPEPLAWRPLGARPAARALENATQEINLQENGLQESGAPSGYRADVPLSDPVHPVVKRSGLAAKSGQTGAASTAAATAETSPYADLDLSDLVDRLEKRLGAAAATGSQEVMPQADGAIASPPMPEAAAPAAQDETDAPASQDGADAPASQDGADAPASQDGADAPALQEDALPPLSPRPVQAVPPSIDAPRAAPGDDMDEALQAALQTLQRMNKRSA